MNFVVCERNIEHGNLVEPGLYRYRMALSGEGDGFSGSGVDLYANAGRAIDWFLVDDASDALFEYRLEVGVAADGYAAASIELLRHCKETPREMDETWAGIKQGLRLVMGEFSGV